MASYRESSNSTAQYNLTSVQLDGHVLMKIIKHCHDEWTAGDSVLGLLVGLLTESGVLEVTNCFAYPKPIESLDYNLAFQKKLMKNFREIKSDYVHVGWYQATTDGNFINYIYLENQCNFQRQMQDSVALHYDPVRTNAGNLTVKAYRLSHELLSLMTDYAKSGDYSPDALKERKISYDNALEELPLTIRNSHLMNFLLCEIDRDLSYQPNSFDMNTPDNPEKFRDLEISTESTLKKQLRLMIQGVDDISLESNRVFQYYRALGKYNQNRRNWLENRRNENEQRKKNGEPPLPEEEVNRIFKQPVHPSALPNMVASAQLSHHAKLVNEFAAQAYAKLFLVEGLHSEEGDMGLVQSAVSDLTAASSSLY